VNVPLLDLTAQYGPIKDDVLAAMISVVERQRFILGEEVVALEEAIATLSGVRRAVSVASGTDALLLPLKLLDLKPGDEVIVPSFTFFASAGAVVNAGGVPVFVDIDPGTFNVTAASVEAAITPRTRAIIVVHLFGQMAPMDDLVPLSANRGIPLIEDAAQSIGARRKVEGSWRVAGEMGWVGTLSFFPTKNLGGYGDGGMILTQDTVLADRLARYRRHGGAKDYHHDEVGTNSRLDTLQAAVLLAKLPSLASWSAARRERALRYSESLVQIPEVTPPVVDQANEHIFHQFTIRAERRDTLKKFLADRGIGTGVYYRVPLHQQPCFAGLAEDKPPLVMTDQAAREVLSLPVYPELTDAQQDWVIESIRAFYLHDQGN